MRFIISAVAIMWFTLINGQMVHGQGDTCDDAIRISDPRSFCSDVGAYNTENLSVSNYDAAYCFNEGHKDIWFRFTAVATDATITIKGDAPYGSGGSMLFPEAAIYSGQCGSVLTSYKCESAVGNNHSIELRQGGLFPGVSYLIRVQSGNMEGGSFQLCLNNFNPPVAPGSDCNIASILCDKSSFTVEKVEGAGADNTELNDASCFYNAGIGINYESSSTWFKFTCGKSGTLEFTLTPLNVTDDLDFVLYALTNGLNDCSDKEVVRCMAAGEIPERYPSPCHGPTGLREGESDISEPAGCPPSSNNFLAPALLEEGKSYVLAVNNYSDTGHGFLVEWGGTSEFLGPQPNIEILPFNENRCYTDPVTIRDSSVISTGEIVSWNWYFGEGSDPTSASGKGPHRVEYDKAGVKTIQLRVESDEGCVSTFTDTLELMCCNVSESVDIGADAHLTLGETHQFDPTVRLKGTDYTYSWLPDSTLSCYTCPDPIATPLGKEIRYTLRVEDEYGCSATDDAILYVDISYPIYTPNAFTPNGDGINDRYMIFSNIGAREVVVLEIFNKWGDKVFSQSHIPVGGSGYGWDGRINGSPAQMGVYVYRAVVEFIDGKRITLTGDLTLLR